MIEILLQMAALIVCGVVWRWATPGGTDVEMMRHALTSLVYYLLLPALVLSVLWTAPLGASSLQISALAILGVLVGLLLGWGSCRLCKAPGTVTGAVILAAAFPNATYLGLPVLQASLGEWATAVAIQYDLFACTPLLLTAGVIISRYYGDAAKTESLLKGLVKVPPLWAAVLAVILNLSGTPQPDFLGEWLSRLGQGVSLLMLISLGMSLQWGADSRSQLPAVLPVVVIQLLIMPLVVWGGALLLEVETRLLVPIVIEAAMPSMVLGLVLCDRYGLNVNVYASAVTVSTAVSLLSLSLWFAFLGPAVL